MDSQERERMRRLLTQLMRSGLGKPARKRTFMEVAGIRRREVSASQILAFLLDTEAEHGMGDLWLRSLLQAASMSNARFDPEGRQLAPASCTTEVATSNIERNLRIDVVAETPELVLGIENKIGASLYNDLGAYAGQVAATAGDRKALLITLTLHDEANPTGAWVETCAQEGVALCNVTYPALFEKVKENAGEAMLGADAEWILFARDFMRTIENLGGQDMQFDSELFSFMSENIEEVELLKGKMEEVARATKEQGERLRDIMLADEELSGAGIGNPTVYSPDKCYMWCSTYYHVKIEGIKGAAHPEISNDLDAMRVRAWVSNAAAKAAVRQAILNAGLPIVAEHEKHLDVFELPLGASDDELVERLKELVRAILPIAVRETPPEVR